MTFKAGESSVTDDCFDGKDCAIETPASRRKVGKAMLRFMTDAPARRDAAACCSGA
jgi:hypothetical protein